MDVDDTIGPSLAGAWLVDEVGGVGVTVDAPPTIDFNPDGTMSGTTGVNRFMGRYDVVGERLSGSALATTRMAGSPAMMEQEARFLAALAEPGTLTFEGGTLTIGTGDHRLHLVRPENAVHDSGHA